ncbi:predicted protein [Histoplasma capsulatum H143]|uniref:Uncharacterized protein n=1 Tax=Ajellomyces capsulatus (strain H143) TaxID=544712 RepID=C6HDH8_AJECH|nr:predicted protein [Histoplasma capsulatum H143]
MDGRLSSSGAVMMVVIDDGDGDGGDGDGGDVGEWLRGRRGLGAKTGGCVQPWFLGASEPTDEVQQKQCWNNSNNRQRRKRTNRRQRPVNGIKKIRDGMHSNHYNTTTDPREMAEQRDEQRPEPAAAVSWRSGCNLDVAHFVHQPPHLILHDAANQRCPWLTR